MKLTYERAHELFQYLNGELYWKIDKGRRAKKGNLAGSIHLIKHKNGREEKYWQIKVDGKIYFKHRIIFLMHNGFMPCAPYRVDHINGNSLDNCITNLRLATPSQNSTNCKHYANNTSGVKGVSWHKEAKKWAAFIRINKKIKLLGYFDDINDASVARNEAENKYYGEFTFKKIT